MTAAKLKIDLSHGLIEVEGTEAFILEVYGDFKESLAQVAHAAPTAAVQAPVVAPAPAEEPAPSKPAVKAPTSPKAASPSAARRVKRNEPKFLNDLDLTKGKLGRLKDFHSKYAPKTNMEHNLIFTYYLADGQDIEDIGEDHLMTCYRGVGLKIPKALRQSILDTANAKGWVTTDSSGVVKLTIAGRNHIEHDLPKAAPTE